MKVHHLKCPAVRGKGECNCELTLSGVKFMPVDWDGETCERLWHAWADAPSATAQEAFVAGWGVGKIARDELRDERDKLRAEVERLTTKLESLRPLIGDEQEWQERTGGEDPFAIFDERNRLRAEVERLRGELDTAWADIGDRTRRMARRYREERDKLRAEVEWLKADKNGTEEAYRKVLADHGLLLKRHAELERLRTAPPPLPECVRRWRGYTFSLRAEVQAPLEGLDLQARAPDHHETASQCLEWLATAPEPDLTAVVLPRTSGDAEAEVCGQCDGIGAWQREGANGVRADPEPCTLCQAGRDVMAERIEELAIIPDPEPLRELVRVTRAIVSQWDGHVGDWQYKLWRAHNALSDELKEWAK